MTKIYILRLFQKFIAIVISTPPSLETIIFRFSNGVIQMVMDPSLFSSQPDVVQNLDFGFHQGSAGLTGPHMRQVSHWKWLES